jgi:TPP-dependent pyruvate/acetoin dehydrogenase alpha subunit
MKGHAAHDNQSYVPEEAIEEWRRRDPIDCFRNRLLEEKVVTASEIEETVARAEALLEEDLNWAESQPAPEPEEALGDVYASDRTDALAGAAKS